MRYFTLLLLPGVLALGVVAMARMNDVPTATQRADFSADYAACLVKLRHPTTLYTVTGLPALVVCDPAKAPK